MAESRAVIYARFSSELQSQASIEDQIGLCRELAGRLGCTVEEVFADRAMSAATSLRPGYQALLAALRSVKAKKPLRTIVAVPVASPACIKTIAGECEQVVCAQAPPDFYSIGPYYQSFEPLRDEDVVKTLQELLPPVQLAR